VDKSTEVTRGSTYNLRKSDSHTFFVINLLARLRNVLIRMNPKPLHEAPGQARIRQIGDYGVGREHDLLHNTRLLARLAVPVPLGEVRVKESPTQGKRVLVTTGGGPKKGCNLWSSGFPRCSFKPQDSATPVADGEEAIPHTAAKWKGPQVSPFGDEHPSVCTIRLKSSGEWAPTYPLGIYARGGCGAAEPLPGD
jgi:hypothetical protein